MSRVLRIVLLVPPAGASGPVPRIAELLAQAFRERGNEVGTATWGRVSRPGIANLAARLAQAWRIRALPSVRGADVIVVETSLEPRSVATDLVLAVLVGRRRRHLVLHLHGGDAHRLGRPDARVFTFVVRCLLRLTGAVCVLSSEERRAILAQFPAARCEIVANPFVAGSPPARPPRAWIADGVLHVLFVGRLLEEKGVLVAVDAIAQLRPEITALLRFAGRGPAASAVLQRAETLGLVGRVEVVGYLAPEVLAAEYANADVFVFPTYWPEGFPTVLSEAMAAGLPIVTTATRGIADHLVDDVNALLVPPHDAAAVARALERLVDEPALAESMSIANVDLVRGFAPSQVVGAYLRVLGDVARAPA
jgi:glycosyltransferase involved in cell wall biosynthesis